MKLLAMLIAGHIMHLRWLSLSNLKQQISIVKLEHFEFIFEFKITINFKIFVNLEFNFEIFVNFEFIFEFFVNFKFFVNGRWSHYYPDFKSFRAIFDIFMIFLDFFSPEKYRQFHAVLYMRHYPLISHNISQVWLLFKE